MAPADLLRATDIAELAGVRDSAVSQWLRRYGATAPVPFPAPWLSRGAGRTAVRLYLTSDVATWLGATGRDEYRRLFEPSSGAERSRRLADRDRDELERYRRRRRPHGRPARKGDSAANGPADNRASVHT